MAGQQRDVLDPVTQGGYVERNHVQPVEQIFAEVAAIDLLFELLVGGGDHAAVHADAFERADGFDTLFVEHPQQLGLRTEAHVADLVQEKRAAVGFLNLPGLVFTRPGEGPAPVAEQLAFYQVFRDGGAVDFDERLLGPRTQGVNGVGHQLLAGSAFAVDEHAAVGGRHQRQLLADGLHGDAFADDGVARRGHREAPQLDRHAALFNRILDDNDDLFNGERLFKEIEGAHFRRADRGFDGGVAGDHDHGRPFGLRTLLDAVEHVHAVESGHPDVEQDTVERKLGEAGESGGAIGGSIGRVAFVFKNRAQRFADSRLIVDN